MSDHADSKPPGDHSGNRTQWTAQLATGAVADVKRALDASDDMPSFHEVCGLFAAVATAPETVPPGAWLEHIKGEHVFGGVAEVQGFTNGLMALYNEVLRSVAEQGAHCVPEPSDHDALHEFCEGYVTIAVNDPTWEANERAFVELLPMFAIAGSTTMDKVGELLPSAKKDPQGWLQKAREELPATVCALYEFWASVRRAGAGHAAQQAIPLRREGAKVGRNDPCPCGSGKKFKKCCAN